MATTKRFKNPPKSHKEVSKLIRYILNPEKTTDEKCIYVGSANCSVVNAADEFREVRNQWQKHSGNYAYHFEQSFKPGETTPEECHKCGEELAEALFAQYGYQVVFATHLDREHLHNHFVVNAVNPVDGKKLQTDHEFIGRMREENDRICKAHNLSVVENPQSKGKSYAEWITDKNGGFTWRGMIKNDIDDIIGDVGSVKELFISLEKIGYTINTNGKYAKLSPPGTNTFFRFYKLGKGYSVEELSERILRRGYPGSFPTSGYTLSPVIVIRYKYKGTFSPTKPKRRYKGFVGMYYYYLSKLRKLLNAPPAYKKRMPAQMRKDSAEVNNFAEDLRLLGKYHIETLEQLTNFYSHSKERLALCRSERNELNQKLAACDEGEQMKQIYTEVQDVKEKISKLQAETKSAERIYQRSENVKETIIQANKAKTERVNENVSRSGSSRYSGESINGRS